MLKKTKRKENIIQDLPNIYIKIVRYKNKLNSIVKKDLVNKFKNVMKI